MTAKTATYTTRFINFCTLILIAAAAISMNTTVFFMTAFIYVITYPWIKWGLWKMVKVEQPKQRPELN